LTTNDLQKYITEFLNSRGWDVWRTNSGNLKTGSYYVRLSPKATGDIIGRDPFGCYVHIEVKTGDDTLSPAQVETLRQIASTKHGITCVATSRKQFEDWFDRCKKIN